MSQTEEGGGRREKGGGRREEGGGGRVRQREEGGREKPLFLIGEHNEASIFNWRAQSSLVVSMREFSLFIYFLCDGHCTYRNILHDSKYT